MNLNPFKSAREVLGALLRMNKSLEELIEDLDRPQPELKERLKLAGETSLKMLNSREASSWFDAYSYTRPDSGADPGAAACRAA